jgi:hypothetical protein
MAGKCLHNKRGMLAVLSIFYFGAGMIFCNSYQLFPPLVTAAMAADPNIWHVDGADGSNSNTGYSREQAFQTISYAVVKSSSGDTILVWPGVYEERVDIGLKELTIKGADYPPTLKAPPENGAIHITGTIDYVTIENFLIINGTSYAGIFVYDGKVYLNNLTVVNNSGGLYLYGYGTNAVISNCIFYNNTYVDVFAENDATWSAGYSYIEDVNGLPAPAFADPNSGNYHLKSQYGRYDPNTANWVYDSVTSFGIDAGDPNVSPALEPMANGGRVNIGAFGGTPYASKSGVWPEDGDYNFDGKVDLLDFNILASYWLFLPGGTDIDQLRVFAGQWLN